MKKSNNSHEANLLTIRQTLITQINNTVEKYGFNVVVNIGVNRNTLAAIRKAHRQIPIESLLKMKKRIDAAGLV